MENLIDEELIDLGVLAEKIRQGFLPSISQAHAVQTTQERLQLA
jgi:hypothetical protein